MSLLRVNKVFDRLSDANLQVTASSILSALTGNPNFPDPKPDLPTLTAAIEAFGTALAEAQEGGRPEIAVKKQKREELLELLRSLGDYVVYAAAGDTTKAASSGFTFAREHGSQPEMTKPEQLLLEDGNNPGELHLSFKRVKSARSYIYQYTTDPITDTSEWHSEMGTISQASFTGLKSGKKYWCRVAAVGINGQTIYSDAVGRLVQ